MNIVARTYGVDATLDVNTRALTLAFRTIGSGSILDRHERHTFQGVALSQVGEVQESSNANGDLELKIEDVQSEIEARSLIRRIVGYADLRFTRGDISLAWSPVESSLTLTD